MFPSGQRSLIVVLSLVLLLSLVMFRIELFWSNWFTVWLFKLLVPLTISGLGLWLAWTARLPWWLGLGLLGIVETGLWGYLQWLQRDRRQDASAFPFFRSVVEDCNRDFLQFNPRLSRYDSSLFYLLRPNVVAGRHQGQEFNVAIRTNPLGLRDDSASAEKPAVIVLGDSFTMGWGVEEAEGFVSRLERTTGRKTLNAGVSSFGTVREVRLLRRLNLDSCRLVVVQYCGNDFPENEEFLKANGQYRPLNRQDYDNYVRANAISGEYFPFKLIYSALRIHAVRLQFALTKPGVPAPPGPVAEPAHEVAFFRVLADLRNQYAGPVLVTYLESYGTKPDVFHRFANQLSKHPMPGVFVAGVDSLLTSRDYFVFDGHINAEGHQKVADQLSRVIRRNGWLREPPKDALPLLLARRNE